MLALLSLGFLIGIAHAFEADHVAAVSSLVSGKSRRGAMLYRGALWGIGHTVSLLLVGGTVLFTGTKINHGVATGLELIVGIMLLGLGGHVLYRLRRDRVHFHLHDHSDGAKHFHLHSHTGETGKHDRAHHSHNHPDRDAIRTLLVGVMHGLAGSAALVLVSAATMASPFTGFAYVLLFGVGSIIGMAAVSLALAIPLAYTARAMTRANGALQLVIGILTMAVGAMTVAENWGLLLG